MKARFFLLPLAAASMIAAPAMATATRHHTKTVKAEKAPKAPKPAKAKKAK